MILARPSGITDAVVFWDDTAGEQLLIHCLAVLSRSTALALGLIVPSCGAPTISSRMRCSYFWPSVPERGRTFTSFNWCSTRFLPQAEARKLTVDLVNHPVLLANRFAAP